jgi:hypothetical protein
VGRDRRLVDPVHPADHDRTVLGDVHEATGDGDDRTADRLGGRRCGFGPFGGASISTAESCRSRTQSRNSAARG